MIQDKRTEEIIGAAMAVHSALGPGFLESVYRNSLMIEFGKRGIVAQAEVPIPVFYEDNLVGDFIADIIVNRDLILELKATKDHHEAHEAQLVNYLKATNTPVGLLLNFGTPSLLIKRKYQNYLPARNPDPPENPPNPVNNSAFTLLELLVAMAVLSILVVMMMGLVTSATALWRTSENRADAYREARAALSVITRDLAGAIASTNTSYFLVNNDGAFDKAPEQAEQDADRAGAAFFLSALPANAQAADSLSDVCEVGYYLAFGKSSALSNAPVNTMNIYRHFRSSNPTFTNLKNDEVFSGASVVGPDSELLARNIRSFRITPLVFTNGAYAAFTPSTNKLMPDIVEVSITAVNQEAAKRLPAKSDWTTTNPAPPILEGQQTFTTRIRLNQPAP